MGSSKQGGAWRIAEATYKWVVFFPIVWGGENVAI